MTEHKIKGSIPATRHDLFGLRPTFLAFSNNVGPIGDFPAKCCAGDPRKAETAEARIAWLRKISTKKSHEIISQVTYFPL
jgi:hypothetical protein